jgi:peptidyl-prolyl cis-trans isomerase B (cyclophilin B)
VPSSRKRQRELARAKYHRQMVRRAAAERRRRQISAAVTVAVAVLLVVGFVSWRAGVFSGKEQPPPPAAAQDCVWNPKTPDDNTKDVGTPPTLDIAASGTRTMTITFAAGVVEAELDLSRAPCTAASFAYLANQSFFDNTTCHRLVDSGAYVLQCGDPSGTGSGGPAYTFADENLPTAPEPTASATAGPSPTPGVTPAPNASPSPSGSAAPSASPSPSAPDGTVIYPKGTLAMANSGPNTNGSQFFIVYRDSPFPPNYTIFGRVTKGLEVIEKIASGGHDGSYEPSPGGGKPKNDATIRSLTVSEVQHTPQPTTLAPPSSPSPAPAVSPSTSPRSS